MHMNMKLHFNWVICLICTLLHFCTCGLSVMAIGVYLPYLKAAANLSGTQTALIVTVRCIGSIIALLFGERFYKRASLRSGVTLSCFALVPAFLILSVTNGPLMCYIAGAILGFSYGFGTMVPITILITNWFTDRRRTATSIALSGAGICTMLAGPAITSMISAWGLRQALFNTSLFSFASSMCIFLVLRDSPAELSLQPYGERSKVPSSEKRFVRHALPTSNTFDSRLMFAIALLGVVVAPSTAHLMAQYQSVGYSSLLASMAYSVFGITMMAGKMVFGLAADRLGSYKVNYFFLSSLCFGAITVALCNGVSLSLLFLSSTLCGIGFSAATAGVVIWTADLFPSKNLLKYTKRMQLAFVVGQFIGTPLPGVLYDMVGSYSSAYMVFSAFALSAMLLVQIAYLSHFRKSGLSSEDIHLKLK